MTDEELLARITNCYLTSRDFNGLPIRQIATGQERKLLAELVRDGLVALVLGDRHPNAHIRALQEHHSVEEQIALLEKSEAEGGCAYPLPKHLEVVVDCAQYRDRPYTQALALGGTQLSHRAFDMSVLEIYRNDPRYHYDCDDIHGNIGVRDEHFETGTMAESDQVLLQSFGFAYDDELNKYVGVFLWDLFKLSPEHQRIWQTRETTKSTKLHPDYFLSSMGHWPENGSIYEAFSEELRVINEMSVAMKRPQLFRASKRPRDFASLLRPTAREFNAFVHLLDKLMSENLNKDFFRGEVPDSDDHQRADGKIEVRPRGTIRMLEDWFSKRFRTKDPAPLQEMVEGFREVRRLRQKPAHAVKEDDFDQNFIHKQRELMLKAYKAVRIIRLAFSNHPSAMNVEVPDWLREGKIWSR